MHIQVSANIGSISFFYRMRLVTHTVVSCVCHVFSHTSYMPASCAFCCALPVPSAVPSAVLWLCPGCALAVPSAVPWLCPGCVLAVPSAVPSPAIALLCTITQSATLLPTALLNSNFQTHLPSPPYLKLHPHSHTQSLCPCSAFLMPLTASAIAHNVFTVCVPRWKQSSRSYREPCLIRSLVTSKCLVHRRCPVSISVNLPLDCTLSLLTGPSQTFSRVY